MGGCLAVTDFSGDVDRGSDDLLVTGILDECPLPGSRLAHHGPHLRHLTAWPVNRMYGQHAC
jgi:hypothetical protein